MNTRGIRRLCGIKEVKDIDGRQSSTLSISQRIRGRRRRRCARWGIDNGEGGGVAVVGIFDIGIPWDEGVVLLRAVLLLMLRPFLFLVEFPLVPMEWGVKFC